MLEASWTRLGGSICWSESFYGHAYGGDFLPVEELEGGKDSKITLTEKEEVLGRKNQLFA